MRPDRPTLPLVNGELSEDDVAQLAGLKKQIEERSGFSCDSYKEKCVRRRIAVRMRARGVHTYGDYATLVASDPAEFQRLLDNLTVNVSKFFRNREVWEALREHVIPYLFGLDDREIRIWSAGCAGGEEAYSIAIELVSYAEQHQQMRMLSRFRIMGSDIDRGSLQNARAGIYGEYALGDTPDDVRKRWFQPGTLYRLAPEIVRMVTFDERNLMSMPFPREQHLIMCRNVLIYFERDVQERLFEKFREALVPGGILVLGKVETLFGSSARGLRTIASRERIFQRI
jgi:chemotaxis protein methyltransferase CheR